MPLQVEDIVVRFWQKVDRSGDCWIWTAYRQRAGYGQLTVNRRHWLAHRFAWLLCNGAIPMALDVLHRCDNPPCVRPDHLFLGTHSDNMKDCVAKGRHRNSPSRGEANHKAKLTVQAVRSIRERRDAGETMRSLARAYGVTRQNIRFITSGVTWKEVS